MNQRQLSYFLEVYEKKSISKAAKCLYISPQGLSKTISSLEKELKVELFTHESNRIIPTRAASKLAIHAKALISEYNLITDKLFTDADFRKPLSILCSFDVPQLFDSLLLSEFAADHPDILLKFREYPDRDIKRMLKTGQTELALIPGPIDKQKYIFEPLITEPFCLVVNKSHRLAENASVSLKDLSNEPLVVKDTDNSTSMEQYTKFKNVGFEPNVILESTDASLIHQMAIDNYAIGLTLKYMAEKISSDGVRIIPFKEKWMKKTIYLVQKKDSPLSADAQIFKDSLFNALRMKE